jgi:hypothetical protein
MSINDFVISRQVHAIIISILFIPAMLFINNKLFLVVRKSRKNKKLSPDMKKPTDGACADFVLFRSGPIRLKPATLVPVFAYTLDFNTLVN